MVSTRLTAARLLANLTGGVKALHRGSAIQVSARGRPCEQGFVPRASW